MSTLNRGLLVAALIVMAACGTEPREREGVWPPETLDQIVFGECTVPGSEAPVPCEEPPADVVIEAAEICNGTLPEDSGGAELIYGPVEEHDEFLAVCCRARNGNWTAMAVTNNLRWGGDVSIRGTVRGDSLVWVDETASCRIPGSNDPLLIQGEIPASWSGSLSLSSGSGEDTVSGPARKEGSELIVRIIGGPNGDNLSGSPAGDTGHTFILGGDGGDTIVDESDGLVEIEGDSGEPGDDRIEIRGSATVYMEPGPGNNAIRAAISTGNIYVNLLDSEPDDENDIETGDGNDIVLGGPGNENAQTGAGKDWYQGGGGFDSGNTGDDPDLVVAGPGEMNVYLGSGDDMAFGGSGLISAYGEFGDDTILGDYAPGCGGLDEDDSWPDECVDEAFVVEGEQDHDYADGGPGEGDFCIAEYEEECEDEREEVCGDTECRPGESCESCPEDCGECVVCGDGDCHATENCGECPEDCGECPEDCGDGDCNSDMENCDNCPRDCGRCPYCGDDECGPDESCRTCSTDCGACPPGCGDESCDSGTETCRSCPEDCGACPPECGDDDCDPSEDCLSCPDDCGRCDPVCGDEDCEGSEDCESCPEDCGECVVCGDDECDITEDCGSCPDDCGCEEGELCTEGVCEPDPCGDGVCRGFSDPSEDCLSCPDDCGDCPPECDDGTCEGDEDCESCPEDCGECVVCGDDECDITEDCGSCVEDCGRCPECGDGTCDPDEDCGSCVEDCSCEEGNLCIEGICLPDPCGDGVCSAEDGEDCDSCFEDCGACHYCGNGICEEEAGEYCRSCERDCGRCDSCGDGMCSGDDACETCPEDCGRCEESCGNSLCVGDEDCDSCPLDCGICGGPVCGDGACEEPESCESCPRDCRGCLIAVETVSFDDCPSHHLAVGRVHDDPEEAGDRGRLGICCQTPPGTWALVGVHELALDTTLEITGAEDRVNQLEYVGNGEEMTCGDWTIGGRRSDSWRGHLSITVTGEGNDVIDLEGFRTGAGTCYVETGPGNDTVTGCWLPTEMWLGPGNDTGNGGPNADRIRGEGGVDTLFGNAGNDNIDGGDDGPDVCDGGTDLDTCTDACEERVLGTCEF